MKVAWINEFPIEHLPDVPAELRHLPKPHPMTWMTVLLGEFRRRRDLEIHVVVLRKGIEKSLRFEQDRVTFHVLKSTGGLRASSFFWYDTLCIRRCLRSIRPDLIHAWGTERGAALVASRLGLPYVVTMQGLMTWYRELVPLNRFDRFSAFLEPIGLRRAKVITTESVFSRNYLLQRYPQADIRQIEHAPAWQFHQVRRSPITDLFRVLVVGTLGYRKGSDLLLKGLNEVLDDIPVQGVVVGGKGDDLIESLRASLRPELSGRLEFKAHLTPDGVAEELSKATISVLPTRADTSPNAVKEAVVAGVPVVASDVGGIPDYVVPGENGILFRSGGLPDFVRALREAYRNPVFRQGKVDASRLAAARAYLSPDAMNQGFFETYVRVYGRTQA